MGGHCKSMKPAWDKLMEEFKDSKTALVADVDCTVHQDLCSKYGVQGYPTIKYGDVNNLEDYQGGRSLEDLQTFAKENLGPTCGPANLDLCDAEQKKKVEAPSLSPTPTSTLRSRKARRPSRMLSPPSN